MNDISNADEFAEVATSLSPEQQGVLADMTMRSLRGSWTNPIPRTKLLEAIAQAGNANYYSSDDLRADTIAYLKRIGRNNPDGRFWRERYQNASATETTLSIDELHGLAELIPNDMKWNRRTLSNTYTSATSHPE
jgi:hypothetical protein